MTLTGNEQVLSQEFYQDSPEKVARKLLGKVLIHRTATGVTAGMIVETEAYYQGDPACHATRGRTRSNASMFGPPGHAYVYLVYGMHHCFNAVTGAEGVGEAVLLRALEPLQGLWLMQQRRGASCPRRRLVSGPGNLCSAMGICREHDGVSLQTSSLYVVNVDKQFTGTEAIEVTSRVGISKGKELPLRFYIRDHPYVSRR